MCRQSVAHVSEDACAGKLYAEIDADMLGFWVAGLLGLLRSCVPVLPSLPLALGCCWVASLLRFLSLSLVCQKTVVRESRLFCLWRDHPQLLTMLLLLSPWDHNRCFMAPGCFYLGELPLP